MNYSLEVLVVVVTYEPTEIQLNCIGDIIGSFRNVYIYDNSVSQISKERIRKLVLTCKANKLYSSKNIYFEQPGLNVGLPAAYNSSIKICDSFGYKYLFFLDQDAKINNDALEKIAAIYNDLEKSFKVGALNLGAVQQDSRPYDFLFNGKFKWKGFYYSNEIIEKRYLTNSTFFISVDIFKSIGGYNESFFLDNSDMEISLRLRRAGYRLFLINTVNYTHNYGEVIPVSSYGIKIAYRPPEREYFAKDLIRCLFLSKDVSFVDTALISLLIVSKLISILFLKDKKSDRLRYMLKGIKELIGEINKDKPRM